MGNYARSGIALLLAGLLAGALTAQKVAHLRTRIALQGDALDHVLADADGDGLDDLFVARRLDDGSRELHVYRLRPNGALPGEPDHVIDIKADTVTWGVGEFRPDEPGVELLLTTRSNVYTLSPRKRSYRDNIHRVTSNVPLLLDLPSDRVFPLWTGIADVNGDGVDEIVLATTRGFSVVDVNGGILGEVNLPLGHVQRPALLRSYRISFGTVNTQVLEDLFVPDENPGSLDPVPILYAEDHLPRPFLIDTDGDGLLDLVYHNLGKIHVHRLSENQGGFSYPLQADVQLPIASTGEFSLEALELVQIGGGPGADLLVTRKGESGTLDSEFQVALFLDALQGDSRLGQPSSLIKVDATELSVRVIDLDQDPYPDLAVDVWTLEFDALGLSVDIRHTILAHRGEAHGGHEDRAAFKYTRDYNADDFTAFSQVPPLEADLTGDGLTDLLESDPHGDLELRPLRTRGSRIDFHPKPSQRWQVDALQSQVEVADLNRDGIGDLLVRHESTLEVFISTRP